MRERTVQRATPTVSGPTLAWHPCLVPLRGAAGRRMAQGLRRSALAGDHNPGGRLDGTPSSMLWLGACGSLGAWAPPTSPWTPVRRGGVPNLHRARGSATGWPPGTGFWGQACMYNCGQHSALEQQRDWRHRKETADWRHVIVEVKARACTRGSWCASQSFRISLSRERGVHYV